MFDVITGIISAIGALGVGLVMLLENVFPPIPSELVMPLAGYLASRGDLALWAIMLWGTVGSVLGAWLWYLVGARLGQERVLALCDRYGRWLTIERSDMQRALDWFERHDGAAVFFGRMVPGVRTLISVPAGLAAMPLPRFLAYTVAGSLIWNTALVAAGYILAANYDRVAAWIDPITTILLLALVAAYLWRLVRRR